MKKYILNRLIQVIPILLGVTFLTFCMMQISMTDAVDMMYEQSGGASLQAAEAKRKELGLDAHFLTQYFAWLLNLFQFNPGNSYISGKPVTEIFIGKLPNTLLLTFLSLILTVVVSFPLGVISALRKNKKTDFFIRLLSFFGNAMPNFFVGMLLIYFLALKLNLFSVMGNNSDFYGVILPAATLAIAMCAKYIRQIRALFLEELEKPYVIGAKARGISKLNVLKGVLKSVAPVLITIIALSLGSLLGGAAIVETIFSWDGVGKLAVDAALMRDYPVLEAYVLFISVIYVAVNLAADICQIFLDPRIRARIGQ